MVEEPTALVGDCLLPKHLSQQGDIESSNLEVVPKVCSFYLSSDGLGLIKAFQGRRRSLFPIRPPPRGYFPHPLSTRVWMLIFGDYRLPETH